MAAEQTREARIRLRQAENCQEQGEDEMACHHARKGLALLGKHPGCRTRPAPDLVGLLRAALGETQ